MMKELVVVTYKLPADPLMRKFYGEDLEYVYDCTAFWDNELAVPEIKKLERKYDEVDSFVCDFAAYNDWVDNATAWAEFVRTGACPLKPIEEDVDVGTSSKTVTIECNVRIEREDPSATFEYQVDLDDVGQIVFTPYDVGTRFCHEGEDVTEGENVRFETVKLTAQMVSESGNYDYFMGTDDVGQFVITPDVEDTSFLTVSVEDSLNLVTEEADVIVAECEDEETMNVLKESNKYRDFEWDQGELYAVVKNDGRYAGYPCTSYEEAQQLAYHPGSKIFKLVLEDDPTEEPLEESLSEIDRMSIVDKVIRGELSVFSCDGEPDPSFVAIPELNNTHGNVTFEYYYDEASGEVVSYSRSQTESE